MVLNIARLVSRQFQFVETELLQAAEECHKQGALLKVIFENAFLTDELKIVACRICARAEVDFVKTSTAFGPGGYTIEDLKLMRAHTPEHIGVKAAGGVRTLEKALEVYQVGCSRFGTTATAAILDEWKARLVETAGRAAS
jgi:deoxyribose-phosphate aldolase